MPSTSLSLEPLEDRRLLSLSVPQYSSLPAAPAALYLDFDGNSESVWGGFQNVETPAYDRDGDSQSFNAEELAAIEEIWKRVAEDFAPFNLNVTTVDPGGWSNPNSNAMKIAIGGSYTDWFVLNASGASQQNSFSNPLSNVAYVFEDDLLDGQPSMVADIVSHEAGHAFGLRHQSVYDASGTKLAEYNTGNSPDWAPLMGNSLFASRSTWYNGTTTSATTFQSELDVIASTSNGFGFRSDDYGDSPTAAAAVSVSNSQFTQTGIIGANGDADYFWFDAPAGNVNLTLDVAAVGANLDSRLELRAADGSLVASAAPANDLGATLTANVAAGRYYAVVKSAGGYGDLGQYTLQGTLPSVGTQVASISGPSELVVGQMGTFAFEVSDPMGGTSTEQFTFLIDFDGDGLIDKSVQGTSGTSVQYAYTAIANYQISVTAFASNGTLVDAVTTMVTTVSYQLQVDEYNPNVTNLVVGLTEGNDDVTAFRFGTYTGVFMAELDGAVRNEFILIGNSAVDGRVILYGLAGDDRLVAALGVSVEIYGGDGNDILIGNSANDLLYGENGDDLLSGGAGSDVLLGGAGRDVLIGGSQTDLIFGGAGDDLLIAGDVIFDDQEAGMVAIWNEWRLGSGYLTRSLHLMGMVGGGLNGNYNLKPGSTINEDATVDLVLGEEGNDLFADIGTNDLATDIASNEIQINAM